jgi:hypothetical protein
MKQFTPNYKHRIDQWVAGRWKTPVFELFCAGCEQDDSNVFNLFRWNTPDNIPRDSSACESLRRALRRKSFGILGAWRIPYTKEGFLPRLQVMGIFAFLDTKTNMPLDVRTFCHSFNSAETLQIDILWESGTIRRTDAAWCRSCHSFPAVNSSLILVDKLANWRIKEPSDSSSQAFDLSQAILAALQDYEQVSEKPTVRVYASKQLTSKLCIW